MYRNMTTYDMDIAIMVAVYKPEALQFLTPGLFAEQFGVPNDAQWEVLREVLYFDVRCHVCAVASAA